MHRKHLVDTAVDALDHQFLQVPMTFSDIYVRLRRSTQTQCWNEIARHWMRVSMNGAVGACWRHDAMIPRPFGRLPSESKTKRPGKWFSSRSNRCAMGLVDMAFLELDGTKKDAKSYDILWPPKTRLDMLWCVRCLWVWLKKPSTNQRQMNADELLFYLSHGFQLNQERRADIRADLQERQAHTDRLMAMSGQPLQEEPETQQNKRNIQNISKQGEGAGHEKATCCNAAMRNFWKNWRCGCFFCRTEGMNRCPTTVPREVRRIFNPRFRFSVELVAVGRVNVSRHFSGAVAPTGLVETQRRDTAHGFPRTGPCEELVSALNKPPKPDKFRNFCLRQTTNWP